MKQQDQIERLAGMISNLRKNKCPSEEIAEIAIIMALRWNQDKREAAPEMYELLSDLKGEFNCQCGHPRCSKEETKREIETLLAKARGEKL